MEQINFLDGESSTIQNHNTHERTTKYNEKVSCELQYISVNELSYLSESDLKSNIRERRSQEDLATSMIKYGMLSPIIVFPNDLNNLKKGYTIIDGEKRVQAQVQNGKSSIMALILYNVTPQTAAVMRLMLKQKVFASLETDMNEYRQLRNITDDFSESDIETMLNCEAGTFSNLHFLQRKLDLYKNDSSLLSDLKDEYNKLLIGETTIQVAVDKFTELENKYLKKKDKEKKKLEKQEQENGLNKNDDINKIDDGSDAIKQNDELLGIGEQDHQQYVGDERRVLPSSLIKQIYARDESMCTICGYGGPKNLSVSTQLEKHHIVDVQYGGTDNINNLILLCPNCHHLVTTFLNGKSTEYNPNPEDLKRNPQNWASVVLGNMGRIAKKEALRRIKKADKNGVYSKVLSGKMTVGQGLKELRVTKVMPSEFNNNPYFTFKKALFYLEKNMKGFKIFNNQILKEYVANQDALEDNDLNKMINLEKDKNPQIELEKLADKLDAHSNDNVKDKILPQSHEEYDEKKRIEKHQQIQKSLAKEENTISSSVNQVSFSNNIVQQNPNNKLKKSMASPKKDKEKQLNNDLNEELARRLEHQKNIKSNNVIDAKLVNKLVKDNDNKNNLNGIKFKS